MSTDTKEAAKVKRSSKARTVTRRIGELNTAVQNSASKDDVTEKIDRLKYAFEELGASHDNLLVLFDDGETDGNEIQELTTWYDRYDLNVNNGIKRARNYLQQIPSEVYAPTTPFVKLKRLSLPTFE